VGRLVRPDEELISILRSPERMAHLSLRQWDRVISQARAAGLLGRLEWFARTHEILYRTPSAPRAHLRWHRTLADACARDVVSEVEVLSALFPDSVPLLLLKGAAYVVAGFRAGNGRFFEDIDVLVPERSLSEVERKLLSSGWRESHLNDYDQRYYREWTHELPPLINPMRGTSVDIHYNILPRVGRLVPNAKLLIEASIPVADSRPNIRTLAPADMVLHSAAHLFQNGEFERGLRDLSDMDLLLRYFSSHDSRFWEKLHERATVLNLERPLFFALALSASTLATPVPREVHRSVARVVRGSTKRFVLKELFRAAMTPVHPSCDTSLARISRFILFVRSHWIRMPVTMLLPHLLHKVRERRMS